MTDYESLLSRISKLNSIGIALSAESNHQTLQEKILREAQEITHADGGTLYLLKEDNKLHFEIMCTCSLGLHYGGSTGKHIPLPPIPLYNENNLPNNNTIAAYAAITGESINIPDIRGTSIFDFSGTLSYDRQTGYHSQSFLAIPMKNHENDIIGVLQLINAKDPIRGSTTTFSPDNQQLVESLASQAAVALSNQQLIGQLSNLLEKFTEVIADAIDEKSQHTGAHCRRVPEITMMLAEAVHQTRQGALQKTHFSEADFYEIKIAAMLHDCGKITTPVHVVEKSTKLQTIFDRIQLVDARYEILRRDLEIAYLREQLNGLGKSSHLPNEWQQDVKQLMEERNFLRKANIGSEFMAEDDRARVEQIAKRKWNCHEGEHHPLLNEDEIYNLTIPKGTLTPEERQIINRHIETTQHMLESLPFPKHLKNVPEIAGGHHERMDGKGYPRGLTRDQMSVQARIMGIADVFEALTAADRPYKKAMKMSQALSILKCMTEDGHIDPEIFEVFVREKVYMRYAEKFLPAEQLDEIDVEALLAHQPQKAAS